MRVHYKKNNCAIIAIVSSHNSLPALLHFVYIHLSEFLLSILFIYWYVCVCVLYFVRQFVFNFIPARNKSMKTPNVLLFASIQFDSIDFTQTQLCVCVAENNAIYSMAYEHTICILELFTVKRYVN